MLTGGRNFSGAKPDRCQESSITYSPETSPSTIRGKSGEVLQFSWDDFALLICEGTNCFICGRDRATGVPFNDEHIVPDWVLREFDLHGRRITLPNGYEHQYGTYTIPCCMHCNSEMGRKLEQPIRGLVAAGPSAIQDHVVQRGPLVPFTWMALIFLKLHLKDRRLRRHLDHRKGDAPISADYTWEYMHHLHAVARAFHIDATLTPQAMGSFFVFPVAKVGRDEEFDLISFTEAQTLYVRLGATGMITVFDDSCAALNRVRWLVEKIDGAVSWVQARELAAHFAMANLDLENRPRFWTSVRADEEVVLGGSTDAAPRFRRFNRALFGALMTRALPQLPSVRNHEPATAARMLEAGELSFLLDTEGNFLRDPATAQTAP